MLLLNATLAEPQHFSQAEKLLLLVLIVVSAASFWSRFGAVLDKILKSRKDPGFHLFTLARRVREFVWEVLCQAKVIRQRPLAGLAHAFVFWGFCAFALVTLNHFAVGFGIGFLDSAGWFGRFMPISRRSSPWPARWESWGFLSAVFSFGPNGWARSSPGNPASSLCSSSC
jgi:hypothetical protein